MGNNKPYTKQPPEFPRHQRHYFNFRPHTESDWFVCWMDVYIRESDTIVPDIMINDWGCMIDGGSHKVNWISEDDLNNEKLKICLK